MTAKKKKHRKNTEKNTEKMKRRLANLKPAWKIGQSGNAAGRPKGSGVLSVVLREMLAKECPTDKLHRNWAEAIAEKMCKRALRGDVAAAKLIGDRVEGKPRQSIAIEADVALTTEDLREKLKAFTAKVRSRLQIVDGEKKIAAPLPVSA